MAAEKHVAGSRRTTGVRHQGLHEVWNAEPAGLVSAEAGNAWLDGSLSALSIVPSALVPEEYNALLNPRHADAAKGAIESATGAGVRRWALAFGTRDKWTEVR